MCVVGNMSLKMRGQDVSSEKTLKAHMSLSLTHRVKHSDENKQL